MKVFKFILVTIILFTNFAQYIAAQDEATQRGKIKAFRGKRQAQRELRAISDQITTKLDVAYSHDPHPLKQLDIYFPEKIDETTPVLVHFHGGGWKMGDKAMSKNHGVFYASQGVLFIAPNYRLSPDVQHPTHVEDCAAALSWVFENVHDLGADKNRIFISGHSAGAHLVALLATDSAYLQKYSRSPGNIAGVIPVDTASYDLVSASNELVTKRFIKEAFGTDPKILRSASPTHNVSHKDIYPKFLILTSGNRESAVAQTKELTDKLKNAGCDAQYVIVDDHTHAEMGMAMYDASDPVGSAMLKFIFSQED